MVLTLEKVHKIGQMIEKSFYPSRKNKKNHFQQIKGMFANVGKKIKKEGKTSVDLVRELREV